MGVVAFTSFVASLMIDVMLFRFVLDFLIDVMLFRFVLDFLDRRFVVLTEDEDCWMCGSGDFLLGRATFVTRLARQLSIVVFSCSDFDDDTSCAIAWTYASRSFSCSSSSAQVVRALT